MRVAIIVLLASFATTIQSPATRGDQPSEPKPAASAANNSADQLITFGMPVAVSTKATDVARLRTMPSFGRVPRECKILGHGEDFVLVQDQRKRNRISCLWIDISSRNANPQAFHR